MFVSHQVRLVRVAAEAELNVPFANELPSRQAQLAALQNPDEFDVLVVGGGATGVGCALDAVTRSELTVKQSRVFTVNAAEGSADLHTGQINQATSNNSTLGWF